MHPNRYIPALIIALLLLPQAAVSGEVYKWIDKQGQTHYSNQRPTDVDNVKVLEVFDSASPPSPAPDPTMELTRIKEFTHQLAEERENRERERLEERLDDLEESYQQLLLETKQPKEKEEKVIWGYPVAPYDYPPYERHSPHWRNRIHKDTDQTDLRPQPRPPFRPTPQPPPIERRFAPREQGAPRPQAAPLSARLANPPAQNPPAAVRGEQKP